MANRVEGLNMSKFNSANGLFNLSIPTLFKKKKYICFITKL